MAEMASVSARLLAVTNLADKISSNLNDKAQSPPGMLSRSSGTLDRLEKILPQVKQLLETFDGVVVHFRDQERCGRLVIKGKKEVGIIERRISSLKRSWTMRHFPRLSKRGSTNKRPSSNEEASETNIAETIQSIKDISNPHQLVTREDIITWIGRRNFMQQKDCYETEMRRVRRSEIDDPELTLLADPEFLSWASLSEFSSIGMMNRDLDLKRVFWYRDGFKSSQRTLAFVTTVIDSLMKGAMSKNVGIGYYHFGIKCSNIYSSSLVITSLLACQFCEQLQGDVPTRVLELYHASFVSKLHEPNLPPTLNDVREVFLALCSQLASTIVVLNELNEEVFAKEERDFTEFRESARWALAATSSRYFVISRHPFDIGKIFNPRTIVPPDVEEPSLTSLDYQVTDINLRKYLDQQLSIHPSIKSLIGYQLLEEIVSTIKEKAGGVFALAKLQFSIVLSESSRRDVRTALETLPSDPYDVYEIILRRIRDQGKGHARLALKGLLWLATSLRLLKIRELQYAVAIEPGVDYVDGDSIPMLESLERYSMGLISVDWEEGTCDLIHETLRAYLQKPERQEELVSGGESWILSNCFALLTYKSVRKPCIDFTELKQRISSHPLLTYATTYWGFHAKSVCDTEERNCARSKGIRFFKSRAMCDILAFLQNEEALLSSMQIAGLQTRFGDQKNRHQTSQILTSTSPLCVAADYGLLSIMEQFLVPWTNANVQDSWGETPLHLASYSGHDEIVGMLLRGGADVTRQNFEGLTPLDCAKSRQQKQVEDILVEHIKNLPKTEVSAPQIDHLPLFAAIYEGNSQQAYKLIEGGVKLGGYYDIDGQTVLQAAASHGDLDMFIGLLTLGAELFEEVNDSRSLFFVAVENGHEDLARFLMDWGTDIETKSSDGRRPLHCAAAQGFANLVELLIKISADVNCVDNLGKGPIDYAISNSHYNIVHLFVKHGVVIPIAPGQNTSSATARDSLALTPQIEADMAPASSSSTTRLPSASNRVHFSQGHGL